MTTATVERTLAASGLIWSLECVRLPTPNGPAPFRPYPYQAALLADRSPRQLVLKARQTGITTIEAIDELHEAIYMPRSLGLIISRDLAAAQNVIRMILDIIAELDDPPRLVKENQSELAFDNGSRIVSQPATAKAGRGYTATRVTLDEAAFMEYDGLIYRAVSPTLSRGGRLKVVSTPNGQVNLFYRLWSGLEGGDWSRHRIHWRDCPAFDEEWEKRERPRYTAEQWASEFECDFVESGGAAFDPEDVAAMRGGWRGLQGPREGGVYVTGVDVGRRHDPTVIVTLDTAEMPWQVVAYDRLLKAAYAQSQAAIDARAGLYGGIVAVESNSIGDPVIEGLTCRARPFVTTAKSKAAALQRLVRAVEQGYIKCGVEQVLSELKSYQWDDAAIVQDSVMALAIALADQREPGAASGLIYPFSAENVSEGAEYSPGGGDLWLSYRWGFTDPTHICLVQRRGDTFCVFDELSGAGQPERDWVREIVSRVVALPDYRGPDFEGWLKIWEGKRPWPRPWPQVWPHATGDPDAVQFRRELKEIGISATPPDRVRHDVEQGQDILRAAISSRRLLVHPGCEETIRCLSNYRARELVGGVFESQPDPGPANQIFAPGAESLRFLFWRLRRQLGLVRKE
jgi:hypothetical protein